MEETEKYIETYEEEAVPTESQKYTDASNQENAKNEQEHILNKLMAEVYGIEASTGYVAMVSKSGKVVVDLFGHKPAKFELHGLKGYSSEVIDDIIKKN